MLSPDVALPGQAESALLPAEERPALKEPGAEVIFDACLVALVMGVIVYGMCEAIARWRWWAVGVWIGAALALPFVIAALQQLVEFMDREN